MTSVVSISARSPLPEDEPFLFRLYASTRAREWAALDLPESEKNALMRMQFESQANSYRSQFPQSEHTIVIAGEEPAGRIWLDEGTNVIKVLDLALLPQFQSRGIGTKLMKGCQERARKAGKPLRHSVLKWNSEAISFYLRLAFTPCGGDEFFLQLEWLP
jgi:GNAT superfamily N-acetyltransferase